MIETLNSVERMSRILPLLTTAGKAAQRRCEDALVLARTFVALMELDALHVASCASIGQLGERLGVAALEAEELLALGRALPLVSGLEERVRAGRIPVASGACLGRIYSNPSLLRPDDEWLLWAERETVQELRRRVLKRRDEHRVGGVVVPLTVFVKPEGVSEFHRARAIASRKAGQPLSGGAAHETIVQHYLACFDVMRRQTGERRVPDTTLVDGRYIPIAVRREIYDRQRGKCAIPYCSHVMFVDFAHIVPHAGGGSREADNLILLCSEHHFWFDQGAIRLRGTAAAPEFFDSRGNPLAERLARGEEQHYLTDDVLADDEWPPEALPDRFGLPEGRSPPGPAPP